MAELESKNHDDLDIPTNYDGSAYVHQNLQSDQREVLLYVLSKLKQWVDDYVNDTSTFQPLRLTICGQAGSGKSVLIKTLVSVIRTMFSRNDCCYVCAPTGSAAYQAGGQTIHSLFGIKSTRANYSAPPSLQQKTITKIC